MEASDIGCPPGNTGYAHIEPCGELVTQALKTGMNVAGPHQGPIFLRTCPGTAQQIYNVLLTLCLHTLIEGLGIASGVDISDLYIGSKVIAVVVEIVEAVFGSASSSQKTLIPLS